MKKLNQLKIQAYILYNSREIYTKELERTENELQEVLNEIIQIENKGAVKLK